MSKTFYDERLEYEKFVSEVLQTRKPPDRPKWYQAPSVVAAATAVLTVAVTSFANYRVAQLARAQDTFIQRQQALFSKKQDLVVNSFDLLAGMTKVNEEKLWIAQGEYDALPKDQRDSTVARMNQGDDAWRRERDKIGLLVHVYYTGDTAMTSSWQTVRFAMDTLTLCTDSVYTSSQQRRALKNACQAPLTVADGALQQWRNRSAEALGGEFARRGW